MSKDPLREHELIKKLTKDGTRPANLIRLKGYVGSSGLPDVVLLYVNLNFDECISIKKADIIHAEEAPEEELEFGGTYIWLKKDAEISMIRTESIKDQAQFLEGEIARAQLKPEISAGLFGFNIGKEPRTDGCTEACTMGGARCPTTRGPNCDLNIFTHLWVEIEKLKAKTRKLEEEIS